MEELHMGQMLEKSIRRKGLNITELAVALGVTRVTIYNWFTQKVIAKEIMNRIASVAIYDNETNNIPKVINENSSQKILKEEAYWKKRYIDLLEQYSDLLKENRK